MSFIILSPYCLGFKVEQFRELLLLWKDLILDKFYWRHVVKYVEVLLKIFVMLYFVVM